MASNNNRTLNENDNNNVTPSSLVVRVDQDQDSNLDALFKCVLNPNHSKQPLQVPLRMRKLPNSFFNPPSSGSKSPSASHSRANSTDSAFSNGEQSNVSIGSQPPIVQQSTTRKGILISHSRAHSSPASLQQNYAERSSQKLCNSGAAGSGMNVREIEQQQQQQQPASSVPSAHAKQRSYDVSSIRLHTDLGDLPTGWEQARTSEGQIYYLNHITKTTQWEDPRIQAQQQLLQQQQAQPQISAAKETTDGNDSLGPLPEGWEQAVTNSGDVYFINHINRTTSWTDPRIPEYLQRAATTSTPRPDMMYIRTLAREREYLKQRTAEIQHQDLLTRQNQQTMGLQMDPFLSDIVDHTRQESGDSGLSLSSNNFLVSPELLTNIDDSMDCFSDSGSMDPLSGLDNADHLVSSLQLNDSLCNEIQMLNDVQGLINPSSKSDNNVDWYKNI